MTANSTADGERPHAAEVGRTLRRARAAPRPTRRVMATGPAIHRFRAKPIRRSGRPRARRACVRELPVLSLYRLEYIAQPSVGFPNRFRPHPGRGNRTLPAAAAAPPEELVATHGRRAAASAARGSWAECLALIRGCRLSIDIPPTSAAQTAGVPLRMESVRTGRVPACVALGAAAYEHDAVRHGGPKGEAR